MSQLRAMQTEAVDRGTLQINVTSSVNAFPVERAEISISYTGVPESTLEKIQTDSSGQTETIELAAPPEEWSLDIEEDRQPYSEYTLSIKAPGFEPVNIAGTEILANVKAIQNIQMKPADVSGEEDQVFVIPAHTLYGDYPPKIAEAEIKPVTETGEIVLSRVVVPEYIVVHQEIQPQPIIMLNIKIISRMLHPVRFMRPGRKIRSGRMYWQSCRLL